ARRQWEKARVPEATKQRHADYAPPSWQELMDQGSAPLPETPDDTVPVVSRFAPGQFPTETGRINFYSPFVAERGRSSHSLAHACYVPLEQGAEEIGHAGVLGVKGIRYPLQLIAPHSIVKADATFDNVPSLRALRPNAIQMNPADAEARSISDGQTAWLYNDFGCIRLPVKITISIPKGIVAVPHGAWYTPDETDRYIAWFDTDGDGVPEPHDTAVDMGGNSNTVTPDRCSGLVDPFIVGMGLNSNGHACQVSPQNPDRKAETA
ncbi:MAG: molybdopterin dinucleotide binding domain-containing protein, partial [Lawsonibacter sp.]|nr:molybdopterin dinucleotide binding domain-containing protein [Lawsonibacter sp.]